MHKGLQELFDRLGVEIHDTATREVSLEEMLAFFAGETPDPRTQPHYVQDLDQIFIPPDFKDYDNVAAHELIHWTGHDKRLGRFKEYADMVCCPHHAYQLDELTAEHGRLLLCEKLGIEPLDRTEYMGWLLEAFCEEGTANITQEEAIKTAKANAEKAVNYLFSEAQRSLN